MLVAHVFVVVVVVVVCYSLASHCANLPMVKNTEFSFGNLKRIIQSCGTALRYSIFVLTSTYSTVSYRIEIGQFMSVIMNSQTSVSQYFP